MTGTTRIRSLCGGVHQLPLPGIRPDRPRGGIPAARDSYPRFLHGRVRSFGRLARTGALVLLGLTIVAPAVAQPGPIRLSVEEQVIDEDSEEVKVRVTAIQLPPREYPNPTVEISVMGSGNPNAVDFAPVEPYTLDMSETDTWTFDLVPENDDLDEQDETISITGTSNNGADVRGTQFVLADDDGTASSIALRLGTTSQLTSRTVREYTCNNCSVYVSAVIEGSALAQPTTVSVSWSAAGDSLAIPFTLTPGEFTLTIPSGERRSNVFRLALQVPSNDIHETDVTITFSGISDLPVDPVEVVIDADDDRPVIRLERPLSWESNWAWPGYLFEEDGPQEVAFALVAGPISQFPIPVTLSVSGSGDPNVVDFVPVPDFEVVIPAFTGRKFVSFTITPVDDNYFEGHETVRGSWTRGRRGKSRDLRDPTA